MAMVTVMFVVIVTTKKPARFISTKKLDDWSLHRCRRGRSLTEKEWARLISVTRSGRG